MKEERVFLADISVRRFSVFEGYELGGTSVGMVSISRGYQSLEGTGAGGYRCWQ